MGKNSDKRKQLRLKCKRRAAALMGAALMTGAVLSGIPATKALAAETSPTPPIRTERAHHDTDDSRPPGYGWHQHEHSWPSPDENQAWFKDGKIYYRSDYRGDDDYYRNNYAYWTNTPVDYVKASAASYGFDSSLDSFTLLTVSHRRALVEVRQHDTGTLYNVLLERTADHDWTIVGVRAA